MFVLVDAFSRVYVIVSSYFSTDSHSPGEFLEYFLSEFSVTSG